MNGERRVRLSERPDDGLFERSESRRTVNEKRLHDRRERPRPGGVIPFVILDSKIKRLGDCRLRIGKVGIKTEGHKQ